MTIPRRIYAEIDSTNEEARRLAQAGAAGPVWVLGLRQTAGRGRRGRAWIAPAGNLAATLLLRPAMAPAKAALLSFVACLAVADLLDACAPGAHIALKWPNDALLNGAKVAGVLLESEGAGGGLSWLAVGIGVNLMHAPPPEPGAAFEPIAVADIAPPPAPEQALDILEASFARWQAVLETDGFAPIRAAFLARAARVGEIIEARLPHETIRGRFTDLDADGCLVLDTGNALRRISAADVFFP
ncbi:MAG: BirA family biotin operon repressor/biotin-[acetyl-CoA-carboxylase] ligase [Paracoccaceae bacterium]|jgi:BirA family biotin operon repressor/biotin-[acetyl-CoA-carboxylase] ligase